MGVVITGATGRVGRATMALLKQAGAPIKILTRHLAACVEEFGEAAEIFEWHPQTTPPPAAALKGAEVVINLMGEPVAGRWSKDKQRRVYDSRITPTEKLIEALKEHRVRFINASSFGIYPGIRGQNYDEHTEIGAPKTTVRTMIHDWERAALAGRRSGNSVAVIRFGMIAGPQAYPQAMVEDFRRGRGLIFGDAMQTVPLIDIDDAARMVIWAAAEPEIEGSINGVAPTAMTLERIISAIRERTGQSPRLRLPVWAARPWLGPGSEYTLRSFNIRPSVALEAGFEFAHPNAEDIIDRALTADHPENPGVAD